MEVNLRTLFLTLVALSCVLAKAKVGESADKINKLSETSKHDESSGGFSYDDEYYYEDDDDDDQEGSGDVAFGSDKTDDEGIKVILETEKKISTTTKKTSTESTEDFHFVETVDKKDELLYEYYNEYYEEDSEDSYEDKDEDTVDTVDKVLKEEIETTIVKDLEEEEESLANTYFKLSYLYIMLASAFMSFCLAIVAFLLCRRNFEDKNDKTKFIPFIVSSSEPRVSGVLKKQSPIVKSYQRVPTSTTDFLSSSNVEMVKEPEKPLLT